MVQGATAAAHLAPVRHQPGTHHGSTGKACFRSCALGNVGGHQNMVTHRRLQADAVKLREKSLCAAVLHRNPRAARKASSERQAEVPQR